MKDRSIIDSEEKEVSLVTRDILNRISVLKNNTKKSMVIGEDAILNGILIFEEILLSINPDIMNDEIVLKIENTVDAYITRREYDMQYINHHIHYGIAVCYSILEGYNAKINKKYSFKKLSKC